MTVIESRGRGGQLLERIRSGKTCIRIGRAYDNDVILEDRYVSPHHLQLTRIDGGWKVEDLDSLNGFRVKAKRGADSDVVRSGDRLRIGHTSLYIYDADHAVTKTLELDGAEARYSLLGRAVVWPFLAAAFVGEAALSIYWTSFNEFEPLNALTPILQGGLAMIAVAAFWALLGRLLRHKANFLAQLSIWLLFSLLNVAILFVAGWIGFNAGSESVEHWIGQGLGTVVIIFSLWGSLLLATNLRARSRTFTTLGIALALLGIQLTFRLQSGDAFSSWPEYYAKLVHPGLVWASPSDQGELVRELDPLFDLADAEAVEEPSP